MPDHRSLIAPIADAALEQAVRQRLARRKAYSGSLGDLEPLALRLGLIRHRPDPDLKDPQLLVFAGDHGLAVDGIVVPAPPSSVDQARAVLDGRAPLLALARAQGVALRVVDAGLAEPLAHPLLLSRKIAHGTRNARLGPAMTLAQAQAAIRAGMEIADTLPGNVLACASLGIASEESAALLLSRLTGRPLEDFTLDPALPPARRQHLQMVLQAAGDRHRAVQDPVELLAALGGFELAMMTGALLVGAGRRHVLVIDGLGACAALEVATRIAPAVRDYAVFARSHARHGLDAALAHFQEGPLLELGLDSVDGTGAVLSWPLLHAAAALLPEEAGQPAPGPVPAPPRPPAP